MGHDLKIHKEYYQQPTVAIDIIKISNVLKDAQSSDSGQNKKRDASDFLNETDMSSQVQQKHKIFKSSDDKDCSQIQLKNSKATKDKGLTAKKQVKRSRWTNEEKQIVLQFFKDNIESEYLPSKKQILIAQQQHECLQNKSAATIKSWLHHYIKNKNK
ncbi:uncharacterized protein LOC127289551 [Leptopilina boulardi]|uniref:uncharacterized protein LOC127289551 n=1 Tax=Leptopilina boulardi TaxID=63433 RepID=UPI0021F52197|nr:uncharacterized protein LOC127289551 [Leptopilina boulardi]